MNSLSLINKTEIKSITRADGTIVLVEKLKMTEKELKIVDASHSLSINSFYKLSKIDFQNFINDIISSAYLALSLNISDTTITQTKILFYQEILEDHAALTKKEVSLIFNWGIRNQLNDPENNFNNLSIVNFNKWKTNYLELKRETMKKFIDLINAYSPEKEISLPDYSAQINSINKIMELKKKSKLKYESEIINYTSILPEVLYKALLFNNHLKEFDYQKFNDQAKKMIKLKIDKPIQISELFEFVSAKELHGNIEVRIMNKAKQLCIIDYLKNKKTIK